MGTFDLIVTDNGSPAGSPANDDICNEVGLTVGSASETNVVAGTNVCAHEEFTEPNTSQGPIDALLGVYDETVWYTFTTGPTPGEYVIDLDVNTTLGFPDWLGYITLYDPGVDTSGLNLGDCSNSPDFSTFVELAGDEVGGFDENGSPTTDEAVIEVKCLLPNHTYYIQVDGVDFLGDQGTFDIHVWDQGPASALGANDSICGADKMGLPGGVLNCGASTGAVPGSNYCSYEEDGEPNVSGGTDYEEDGYDETVWYCFTTCGTPGVIDIDVNSLDLSLSPSFQLYYVNPDSTFDCGKLSEPNWGSLLEEGPGYSDGPSLTASNDYACLLPNTQYFIQVGGLDVPFSDDKDDFEITVTDDGSGMTNPDEICNAQAMGVIGCGANTAVVSNNHCAYEEACEPDGNGSVSGDTDVSSNDYDETVWFTFTTCPNPGEIEIEVAQAGTPGVWFPRFNVYAGTPSCGDMGCDIYNNGDLTFIGGDDNGTGIEQTVEEIFSCLEPNTTYYIQIDGVDDVSDEVDGGVFEMIITDDGSGSSTPANDDLCDAEMLTLNAAPVPGSNYCASEEAGEPGVSGTTDVTTTDYDESVWYYFTADPSRGDYEFNLDVIGNSMSSAFTIYHVEGGSYCTGTTPTFDTLTYNEESGSILPGDYNLVTGSSGLSLPCNALIPGETYAIQVDGWDVGTVGGLTPDQGDFNIDIDFTANPGPANDDLCDCTSLTLGTALAGQDNYCASEQTGEPNVSGAPYDAQDPLNSYDESVWYCFTAPASGLVEIDIVSDVNIDLNYTLYVSNGGACDFTDLTEVDANDDLTFDVNGEYECLVPSCLYYIQVDGGDLLGNEGEFTIEVTDDFTDETGGLTFTSEVPANDAPCDAIDVTSIIGKQACNGIPIIDPGTGDWTVAEWADGAHGFLGSDIIDYSTNTKGVNACAADGGEPCGDVWYCFTVPGDATQILIEGNDEYGLLPPANSDLVIQAFRPASGSCGGGDLELSEIDCDDGGSVGDAEFIIGDVVPGEKIFLRMYKGFDIAAGDLGDDYDQYGFCITCSCITDNCAAAPAMAFDVPYCWTTENANPDASDYAECGDDPSTEGSVYYTFEVPAGEAKNVGLVFEVSDQCGTCLFGNPTSNTTIALYADDTPCDGVADGNGGLPIDCDQSDPCAGPSHSFTQSYTLDPGTYVIMIDGGGCGPGGTVMVRCGVPAENPLPVELTTFIGWNDGAVNELQWTTASEFNSDKFIIERSADAVSFEYIGEVDAAGNSSVELAYNFTDGSPIQGINYYRLKQIDNDGSFEYSNVIAVRVQGEQFSKPSIVNIYPNPTNGLLNVVVQVPVSRTFDMNVIDVVGRLMYDDMLELDAGLHTLQLNAKDYAHGVYIVNFKDITSGDVVQGKFVKQK